MVLRKCDSPSKKYGFKIVWSRILDLRSVKGTLQPQKPASWNLSLINLGFFIFSDAALGWTFLDSRHSSDQVQWRTDPLDETRWTKHTNRWTRKVTTQTTKVRTIPPMAYGWLLIWLSLIIDQNLSLFLYPGWQSNSNLLDRLLSRFWHHYISLHP